jgi:molecular chaperone DnaK
VVLGIDLGTTHARCAAVVDGFPRLLPLSPDGASFIPTVVALGEGNGLVVGARAMAQIQLDPARAVFAPKRLLGRRARSRQVREFAARLPYGVVPDPAGDAGVELDGTLHPLPEVASTLLAALKDAAQEHLGRSIRRAILCVPAYFSGHQRTALFRAGRLAGLEVVRIFNEPSAVALAYGHGRGLARKRVLVFDLGGGTFDASVVQITGNELEVVATGGDVFLGGMEFDERIVDQLVRELREAGHPAPDACGLQRIRLAAEQAKILLSELERAPVHVRLDAYDAAPSGGAGVEFRTELTRATLERLTADLVDRTVETTRAVLDAAGLAPASLDDVLVVGGQSRAPAVRRGVAEALGRMPRADVDPHSAVALGAAILGEATLRSERGRAAVSLSEVLSLPIGIALRGGGMRRVLDRRTPLPAEKTISLPVDAGTSLGVAVFQGNAPLLEDNEYLGSVRITPDRPGEATLHFRVAAHGTLHLVARAPGAREEAVLATAEASDDVRAEILARAPLPGEPDAPASAGGLLSGIKRLFGRR